MKSRLSMLLKQFKVFGQVFFRIDRLKKKFPSTDLSQIESMSDKTLSPKIRLKSENENHFENLDWAGQLFPMAADAVGKLCAPY